MLRSVRQTLQQNKPDIQSRESGNRQSCNIRQNTAHSKGVQDADQLAMIISWIEINREGHGLSRATQCPIKSGL
jgi:hypothetical protein